MNESKHGVTEQKWVLAIVESPRHLVQIRGKMLRGNTVPRAHNAPFEQRERRFDGIGMNVPVNVTALLVLDCLVLRRRESGPLQGRGIGRKLVRHNHVNIAAHVLGDVLRQCSGLCIFGMEETECSTTLPDANDYFFGSLASVDTVADLLAANIGLIDFDGALHVRRRDLVNRVADAMAKVPSSSVIDLEHTGKLVRTHALPRLAEQIRCKEPFGERQMGIMENSSSGHGELVAA